MIWEQEITILEGHLDTFGHINNATYLQLFEQARWEIITQRGYGLKEVQKHQIGPTILEINLQFKREIKLREKIKIKTQTVSHERKITKMRQTMVNEKGEEACVAEFVISLFDLRARKLIEPTKEWRFAIALPT